MNTAKTSIAAVAALLFAFAARAEAEGEEDTPPALRFSQMPKVATSADDFVEVVAADVPGDPVGYRLPILQFATSFIREFSRVHKLEMKRDGAGLIIHALNGRTNDVRVVTRSFRRRGRAATRVWLPSPGYSDIEALGFAIAKAYLRAWTDRESPRGAKAGEVPDWLVQGAMRCMDQTKVDGDRRRILELWSTASLPSFPALCADLKAGTGDAAAANCYVVSWMREKRILPEELRRIASGKKLDGARVAEALAGAGSVSEQDRFHDERMARLMRAVLTPGEATAWDVKVFASRLLLYASEFDKNKDANGTPCTFREAIARAADSSALREAAAAKAQEMPFYAIGRGRALAETSEAYRVFLLDLARGEEPARLGPALDRAEAMLEEMLNEDRKDDNR